MRTFKGQASLSFKIVVPDQFITMFRDAAQQSDASEFHKLMHAKHPENDEAFAEAIISNALRRVIRNSLLDELHVVGLGATVSPVTMSLIGMAPDHDAPAEPQLIEFKRNKGGSTDVKSVESQDDIGGALAYIASNHTPVNPAQSHGGID
jgi:hypothetical protein